MPRLLDLLLLPPIGLLWLGIVGLALLGGRRRRLGVGLLASAVAALLVLSSPVVAALFLRPLDRYPVLDPDRIRGCGRCAIVVLGAGGPGPGAEIGLPSMTEPAMLSRLRYGAWLKKATGVPLLVSSGIAPATADRELRETFGVGVDWVHAESWNTWQDAVESASILLPAGRSVAVVVTDFWHLPRAVPTFRRAGFEVIPAPTGFALADGRPRVLPSLGSWAVVRTACHEYLGMVWYRLRHRL